LDADDYSKFEYYTDVHYWMAPKRVKSQFFRSSTPRRPGNLAAGKRTKCRPHQADKPTFHLSEAASNGSPPEKNTPLTIYVTPLGLLSRPMNTPHIINGWNGTLLNKDHQILSFRKVDETLGWLSNMSPHPVRFRTILYPTCEHFFQCLRFENEGIRKEILKKNSPMTAKMISKKYKDEMVITPRSQVDLDLMRTVIRMKMVFYPKLRNELMTQNSDSIIIEDCSKRGGESSKFWGMKLTEDQWEGENWLGRLWMEYRSELQGKSVVSSLDTTIWPGSMWTELQQTLFKKIS
jgi:ribA/ribD-fused uncharacterized protein